MQRAIFAGKVEGACYSPIATTEAPAVASGFGPSYYLFRIGNLNLTRSAIRESSGRARRPPGPPGGAAPRVEVSPAAGA